MGQAWRGTSSSQSLLGELPMPLLPPRCLQLTLYLQQWSLVLDEIQGRRDDPEPAVSGMRVACLAWGLIREPHNINNERTAPSETRGLRWALAGVWNAKSSQDATIDR